ncbi:hypothetical protein Sjap_014272 [Stephania japonica]|uniref:Uncharacterized protein n=1 Tax=Stephania japonica TaxID=461633 RepID=A0AAP0J0B4_9MAGN
MYCDLNCFVIVLQMKMKTGKRFGGTDRPGVWNCDWAATHHRAPSDLRIIPTNAFHLSWRHTIYELSVVSDNA